MNPPFNALDAGRLQTSPVAERHTAHVAAPDLLSTWAATAAQLLGPGGQLTLVWRADGLSDVLKALGSALAASACCQSIPGPMLRPSASLRVRRKEAARRWPCCRDFTSMTRTENQAGRPRRYCAEERRSGNGRNNAYDLCIRLPGVLFCPSAFLRGGALRTSEMLANTATMPTSSMRMEIFMIALILFVGAADRISTRSFAKTIPPTRTWKLGDAW